MNAGGWTLLDPGFLAVLPVALIVTLLRLRRRRAALLIPDLSLLAAVPSGLRARLASLAEWMRFLVLVCLGLALARPVTRDLLPLREVGADLLLVLDVSSSMLEEDMDSGGQRRIDAAREQATQFAAKRTQDRVGLLVFALYPELRCPPTLDERAVAAFLSDVQTVRRGSEEDRTGIGIALAKAVTILEESEAKARVVVLLSDGENNVPDVMPEQAAKLAKDAGVRVHTIGLGEGRRVQGPFGTRVLPVDFRALEQIAEETGGRFFRAFDTESLARVYAEIDAMEKVELEDPRYRTTDWFHWPLGAGALALVLTWLLESWWLRRLP